MASRPKGKGSAFELDVSGVRSPFVARRVGFFWAILPIQALITFFAFLPLSSNLFSDATRYGLLIVFAVEIAMFWFVGASRREFQRRIMIEPYGLSLMDLRDAVRSAHAGDGWRVFWALVNTLIAVACISPMFGSGPTGATGNFLAAALLIGCFLAGVNAARLWLFGSEARRFLLAWGSRAIGFVIFVAGIVVLRPIVDEWVNNDPAKGIVILIVTMCAFYVLLVLVWRSTVPLTRASLTHARTVDRRAPIVFIRSFSDDQTVLPDGESAIRLEELVSKTLRPCGPFVAIGKPGEVRLAGAARAYFKDDEWRSEITRLFRECACVVAIAGVTDNLRWELGEFLRTHGPRKLIVLFPREHDQDLRTDNIKLEPSYAPWWEQLRHVDLNRAALVTVTPANALIVVSATEKTTDEMEAALHIGIFGFLGLRRESA